MAIPLGRSLPSASCDRPERRPGGSPGDPGSLRDACRSYLVLLPVGFSLPPPLPAARCALTAPFHPCRLPGEPGKGGGVLSVALSLESPPPGVTRHRTSVEPGLSSLRQSMESGHPTVWRNRFGQPRLGCQSSFDGTAVSTTPSTFYNQVHHQWGEIRHAGVTRNRRISLRSR